MERWVRERETYFFSLLGSCIVSKDRACDLMPREGAKQVKKSAWLVGTNVLNWPYTQALVEKNKMRCRIGATCVRQTSRIRERLAPRSTLATSRLAHRMVAASNGVEVSNGVKASSFEYKGWRFDSVSGPILSTCERGTLTDKLSATAASKGLPSIVPPLPEAIFGHSYLTMTHEASGRTFSIDAAGAIACWMRESAHKGSGGIRVTTAKSDPNMVIRVEWLHTYRCFTAIKNC